ncbi:Fatty acyl-CoA reductase 2 [Araneus ventricosus]|uniref:Fatty acyl-CoA reductase n=1 Tax=Araneus ventricosus TaxID=182803 RepID=A0A4Y2X7I9_ARAVE|nr:Fatty acyl-CoA reductase 2 [Araneus ventricosus]
MRKFEALVYTSTAYSNCNHTEFVLKEEIYRLPFRAEKFLDALKNDDDERLQEMHAHCKPDWPNTYTFSKCLAENVIMDTASDLPIAIIRPSIVGSTWKHPMPVSRKTNNLILLYKCEKYK